MNQNQRWELGRDSYRPAGEVIRPSEYEVAEIPGDTIAREFVETHHYSRTYVAARFRFGLYRHGALVGVAVFSQPVNNRTLTNVFPCHHLETCELGRLVLLDEVPGNGESFFVAECFRRLRKAEVIEAATGHELRGILGVVSFSDPVPRKTSEGRIVLPGHVGTVYQALSAIYVGRGTARTIRLLPDGTVLNERAIQKIRKLEKGWKGQVEKLRSFGADGIWDDPRAWLRHWANRLTQPLAHAGNHKYVWALGRKMRPFLPDTLPYPKKKDGVA